MSKVFFHTLCTCGADASKIARGYPIGLRPFFPGKHCLRLTLRSLTACRAIWRNSISDKDLRAWHANTAERISFCCRSEPTFAPFAGCSQGWPARPARARKRILASIGSTATQRGGDGPSFGRKQPQAVTRGRRHPIGLTSTAAPAGGVFRKAVGRKGASPSAEGEYVSGVYR